MTRKKIVRLLQDGRSQSYLTHRPPGKRKKSWSKKNYQIAFVNIVEKNSRLWNGHNDIAVVNVSGKKVPTTILTPLTSEYIDLNKLILQYQQAACQALYYRRNQDRIQRRTRERYHIEKFFHEHPTHWIARLFQKCLQCKQRKFILFFNGKHGIFCDKCLAKNTE